MGKMKQIAMIIAENDVETLEMMISLAMRNDRSNVFYRGETYTMEQANNMLSYIYDELNKIRRAEQSTE